MPANLFIMSTTAEKKQPTKPGRKGRKLTALAVRHDDKAELDRMARAYRGMKLADTINLLVAGWNLLTDEQKKQAYTTPKDSAPATVTKRSSNCTDAALAPA